MKNIVPIEDAHFVVSYANKFYGFKVLVGENRKKVIERILTSLEEETGNKIRRPVSIRQRFNIDISKQLWILSEHTGK